MLPRCAVFARSGATVEALTDLTCLSLARERFTELLGPLQDIMAREKSPDVRTSAVLALLLTLCLACQKRGHRPRLMRVEAGQQHPLSLKAAGLRQAHQGRCRWCGYI